VIELAEPTAEEPASQAAVDAQLTQAQRQADLAAIERQRLLEQLEEAHERIAALAEEREQWLEGTRPPDEPADRLDAALAREQALRWRVQQIAGELEQVRARPVDELEARLAQLEARGSTGARAAGREGADRSARSPQDGRPRLRPELDRLLRRIERGGLPSAELHRELVRLRRRL
jgi:chromosome segregation ATPase